MSLATGRSLSSRLSPGGGELQRLFLQPHTLSIFVID